MNNKIKKIELPEIKIFGTLKDPLKNSDIRNFLPVLWGIRSIPPALACFSTGRWVYQVRPLYIFANRSRRRDAQGLASSNFGFVSTKGTDKSGSCEHAKRLETFWV